jgi:hypothetical protein
VTLTGFFAAMAAAAACGHAWWAAVACGVLAVFAYALL